MNTQKKLRLEQRKQALQSEWNLKNEKLTQLRQALAIESGITIKFQLQKQTEQEEKELKQLENELDRIDLDLSVKDDENIGSSRSEPSTKENVIGIYQWLYNLELEFLDDGTVIQPENGDRGTWTKNTSGDYQYTLIMNSRWRQDFNLSPNGDVNGINTEPNGNRYPFQGRKL